MKHSLSDISIQQLVEVADYLEANPDVPFDMEDPLLCVVGYAQRLGKEKLTREVMGMSMEDFVFLFSSQWKFIDNSTQGAVKRIRHYIENGTPEYRERFYDHVFPVVLEFEGFNKGLVSIN